MDVSIPDGSVHVTTIGEGRPVLLVHGFPFSSAMWEPVAKRLAAAGFRAIVPDLRGFGSSSAAGAGGIAAYTDDLIATLDAIDQRSALPWVGFSMGGYVVLDAWRRHAGRISALALVDTRATPDDAGARAGRRATATAVEADGSRIVADAMLPKLFGSEAAPELRQATYDAMMAAPREGVVAGLLAMAFRADSGPTLPTIAVPTLVLVGAQDAITPPKDSEAMVQAISGATLSIVPGAGHLAPFERPDDVAEALIEWLGGRRTVSPS